MLLREIRKLIPKILMSLVAGASVNAVSATEVLADSATASLAERLATERDERISELRAQFGLNEENAAQMEQEGQAAVGEAATSPGSEAYRRFQELANGSSAMRNLPLAFDFLRDAAEQGYAIAQHDLGYIYEHGQMGVSRSLQEAVRWYGLAAAQGFEASISRLARLEIDGPAYRPSPSTRFAAILTCTLPPSHVVPVLLCLEDSVLTIEENGEMSEYAHARHALMNGMGLFEEAGSFVGASLFITLPDDFMILTRNSARDGYTLSLFVLEVEEGEHWRSITDGTQVCRQDARSFGGAVLCESSD